VSYGIRNAGVGPVNLVSVRLLVDDREVHNPQELLASCCGLPRQGLAPMQSLGLQSESSLQGVLDARGSLDILAWRRKDAPADFWRKLDDLPRHLAFDVCYCSALDQCWITDIKTGAQPRAVVRCPSGGTNFNREMPF